MIIPTGLRPLVGPVDVNKQGNIVITARWHAGPNRVEIPFLSSAIRCGKCGGYRLAIPDVAPVNQQSSINQYSGFDPPLGALFFHPLAGAIRAGRWQFPELRVRILLDITVHYFDPDF